MSFTATIDSIEFDLIRFTFRQNQTSDYTKMYNLINLEFVPVDQNAVVYEGAAVVFKQDTTTLFSGTIDKINNSAGQNLKITASSEVTKPTGTVTENRLVYVSGSQLRTALNFDIQAFKTLNTDYGDFTVAGVTHYSKDAGYTEVFY